MDQLKFFVPTGDGHWHYTTRSEDQDFTVSTII